MKLLLVDNRVGDIHIVKSSLLSETEIDVIVFDYLNETIESFMLKIDNKQYSNIGLFQKNLYEPYYSLSANIEPGLLKNVEALDNNLSSWKNILDFFIQIKNKTGFTTLDLMGCGIYNDKNWKYIIKYIEKKIDININASIDYTGNAEKGGNWILEEGNVNLIGTYFTDNIKNYKYLLDISTASSYFITNDNKLYGCGPRTFTGYPTSTMVLKQIPNITNIKKINSNGFHTIIQKEDNSMWGTGWNGWGQLAIGYPTGEYIPDFIPLKLLNGNEILDFICSENATFIVKTDGTVWTIGLTDYGALGIGSVSRTQLTTMLSQTKDINNNPMTNVAQFSTNGSTSLIRKTDGTLWSCGLISANGTETWYGSYIRPIDTNNQVINDCIFVHAAQANNQILIIRENGSIWMVNLNTRKFDILYNPQPGFKAIKCCGGDTIIFITEDGSVWTYGGSRYGAAGYWGYEPGFFHAYNPANNNNVKATNVYLTGYTSVYTKEDGTTWASGLFSNIYADGTVAGYGGGMTNQGSIGFIQIWTHFTDTYTIGFVNGKNTVLIKNSDKTGWFTENNFVGLGFADFYNNYYIDDSGMTDVKYASSTNIVTGPCLIVLKNDGSVWEKRVQEYIYTVDGPFCVYTPINNIKAVFVCVSNNVSSIVMSDGSLWMKGINYDGQFGTSSININQTVTEYVKVYTPPDNLKVIFVNHVIGNTSIILSDGSVWMAGNNNWGQFGTGNNDLFITFNVFKKIYTPVNNVIATKVNHQEGGGTSTILLLSDGSVKGAGNAYAGRFQGQFRTPDFVNIYTPVNNIKAIDITGYVWSTFILKSDGTVWSMGTQLNGSLGNGINQSWTGVYNNFEQCVDNTNTPLTNVVSLSGGTYHFVALKNDGTAWAIGSIGSSGTGQYVNEGFFVNAFSPVMDSTGGIIMQNINFLADSKKNINITNILLPESLSYSNYLSTYNINYTLEPINDINVINNAIEFNFISSDNTVASIDNKILTVTGAGNTEIICKINNELYYPNSLSKILHIERIYPTFTRNNLNPLEGIFSIPSKVFEDPDFDLIPPNSNSPGNFSFSTSDTSKADILGTNTITINGAGNVSITATQEQTKNYFQYSITSNMFIDKAQPKYRPYIIPDQIFENPNFIINNPQQIIGKYSPLPTGNFRYSVSNDTDVINVIGPLQNIIEIKNAGTVEITAIQAESTNYYSGSTVGILFIDKTYPTYSENYFINDKVYLDPSFTIPNPESSSPGSFTFSSSNNNIASIIGSNKNIIQINNAGTTEITATQEETRNYFSSSSIKVNFVVKKALPEISTFIIPSKVFEDPDFEINPPISNSPGSFYYNSLNTEYASIVNNSNIIRIEGAGEVEIIATQNETNNFLSRSISTLLIIDKATPRYESFSIPDKVFGNRPFNISNPNSTSNGVITYTSNNNNLVRVIGPNRNLINILGAGTVRIIGNQTETNNYKSGSFDTLFFVDKAQPSINSFTIPNKVFGNESFIIDYPGSTSNGVITFSSSDNSVATISGNRITIIGAGSCNIIATQNESNNYYGGSRSATFFVDKAQPSINSFTIPNKVFGDESFIINYPGSTSNGAITFSSSNNSVATITGNRITIIGAGTCNIIATQNESNNYYSGSKSASFFIDKAQPSINSFTVPNKVFGNESFIIDYPGSTSNGAITFSSSNNTVATISGNRITIIGAGTCNIIATQNESNNYYSGSKLASFFVNKAQPSINSFTVPNKVFGDDSFIIDYPGSTSNGAITFSSSDNTVATISGNRITIIGAGTCNIIATQNESNNYYAGSKSAGFFVDKAQPSINSFTIPNKVFGNESFIINYPGSTSNGAITFSSSDNTVATISGNRITIIGAGTCNIIAIQNESNNYYGDSRSATFFVDKAQPSINSFTIPNKVFGDESFIIDYPGSTSNGAITFSSSDNTVATISGNRITIIGAGSCNIIATQNESNNYYSGSKSASFFVDKAQPSINSFTIPNKVFGDDSFIINYPESTSNGAITFSSSDNTIATISGNRITIIGSGTCNIIATQNESNNYYSGSKSASFFVDKAQPSINSFTIPNKVFGDDSFIIDYPGSTSNGAITFSSSDNTVATISSNRITIIGAGSCNIIATQNESNNYYSGSKSASFFVDKAQPIIGNFIIPDKVFGDSPFIIMNPSSTNTNNFTNISLDTDVATIETQINSGIIFNILTIKKAGSVIITATQEESKNYYSGSTQTLLNILKANLTGKFIISNKTYLLDTSFDLDTFITETNYNGDFKFNSNDENIISISNKTARINGAGIVTLTATPIDFNNYNNVLTTNVIVNKAPSQISTINNITVNYGSNPTIINTNNIETTNTDLNKQFRFVSNNTNTVSIDNNTLIYNNASSIPVNITCYLEESINFLGSETSFTVTVLPIPTVYTSEFIIPTEIYELNKTITITEPESINPGTFTYESSDPTVASVSGNILTIKNSGYTIIKAIETATTNYLEGIIETSFSVLQISTLGNFIISNIEYSTGLSFDLSTLITETNVQGGFRFISSNESIVSIVNTIATINNVGENITITAIPNDNTNYDGVLSATFNVISNQVTGNFIISNIEYSTGLSFDLSLLITETTVEGGFTFSSSDETIVSIIDTIATINNVGENITITATPNNITKYTGVLTATFNVIQGKTVLKNFRSLIKYISDNSYTITPPETNNNIVPIIYTSSNVNVAKITDTTVNILSEGITTITAIQDESSYYSSGSISATLLVSKEIPIINEFILSPLTTDTITFTLPKPISNSDGEFIFTSSQPSVLSIENDIATINKSGIITITATQLETLTYRSKSITAILIITEPGVAPSNFVYTTSSNIQNTLPSINNVSIIDGVININIDSINANNYHLLNPVDGTENEKLFNRENIIKNLFLIYNPLLSLYTDKIQQINIPSSLIYMPSNIDINIVSSISLIKLSDSNNLLNEINTVNISATNVVFVSMPNPNSSVLFLGSNLFNDYSIKVTKNNDDTYTILLKDNNSVETTYTAINGSENYYLNLKLVFNNGIFCLLNPDI